MTTVHTSRKISSDNLSSEFTVQICIYYFHMNMPGILLLLLLHIWFLEISCCFQKALAFRGGHSKIPPHHQYCKRTLGRALESCWGAWTGRGVGERTPSSLNFGEHELPTFLAVQGTTVPWASEMACLQKVDNSPACSSGGQWPKPFPWKLHFNDNHTRK